MNWCGFWKVMAFSAVVAIFLLAIIQAISTETGYTDCYDKYGNKMIGQRCIIENDLTEEDKQIYMIFFPIGIMLIGLFAAIMIGRQDYY